jgi:hypothetical protein
MSSDAMDAAKPPPGKISPVAAKQLQGQNGALEKTRAYGDRRGEIGRYSPSAISRRGDRIASGDGRPDACDAKRAAVRT